jgi:hypothetical protein
MRNIRIQSLMVVNLSCVAQTGLESMLPIATPQNLFQQTARMAFTPTDAMTLISAALAAPAASIAAKPIAVDFTTCFILSPHLIFVATGFH